MIKNFQNRKHQPEHIKKETVSVLLTLFLENRGGNIIYLFLQGQHHNNIKTSPMH